MVSLLNIVGCAWFFSDVGGVSRVFFVWFKRDLDTGGTPGCKAFVESDSFFGIVSYRKRG